jgi:hypothetical protein
MTHFLARLVERARGTAARVEPIIAPRFAPDPPTPIAATIEAPSLARPGAVESLDIASPWPRVPKTETPPLPRARLGDKPLPPRDRPDALTQMAGETLLVPLPPEPPDIAPSPLDREVETVRGDASAPIVRPVQPHPPRLEKSGLSPFMAKTAQIWPKEQPAEPPIVRVTIGRIEVRAAAAPVAAARQPVPPSPPKLTLEAHLKSRREGGR